MPHVTLEYSANLRADGRFPELCRALAQFMVAMRAEGKPVFPLAGVRVRAIACEAYCIADGSLPEAGFVHAIFKLAAGRSEETKARACAGLFEVMKDHFAGQYASRPLALSLEMLEFSEAGTLKHSNLRARLAR